MTLPAHELNASVCCGSVLFCSAGLILLELATDADLPSRGRDWRRLRALDERSEPDPALLEPAAFEAATRLLVGSALREAEPSSGSAAPEQPALELSDAFWMLLCSMIARRPSNRPSCEEVLATPQMIEAAARRDVAVEQTLSSLAVRLLFALLRSFF